MAGRPWGRRGVGRLLALLLLASITGPLVPATVPAPRAAAVELAPAAERLDPSPLLPPLMLPGSAGRRDARPAANASPVDAAHLPGIDAPRTDGEPRWIPSTVDSASRPGIDAPAAGQLARPLLG